MWGSRSTTPPGQDPVLRHGFVWAGLLSYWISGLHGLLRMGLPRLYGAASGVIRAAFCVLHTAHPLCTTPAGIRGPPILGARPVGQNKGVTESHVFVVGGTNLAPGLLGSARQIPLRWAIRPTEPRVCSSSQSIPGSMSEAITVANFGTLACLHLKGRRNP